MRLGYSPVTARILDLDAAFRLAAELELDFVELSHDLQEVMPQTQDVQRVRELTAATGVGCTVHLSFVDLNLASLIPAARRNAVERTLAGLEYSAAVGATCGVLHTGHNYVPYPQAAALAAAALEQSLQELADPAVPLAIENLALDATGVVQGPDQLAALTGRHDMHNCLDFGHAHVEGTRTGQELIDGYLQSMAGRLIHLHLHNNHGHDDEHLDTGNGDLDFGQLLARLPDFSGTACLEISTGETGVRESVRHIRSLSGAAA